MATNQNTKRKDKARVVLRKGESQRKDGKYDFRWTSPDGKRHSIYAVTLEELREKENDIQRDSLEGIKAEARYVTLNDVFTLWAKVKRGLKDNTFPELSVPLSAVRGARFRQIEGVCAQKVGCEAVLQHAGRRAGLAGLYD